MIAHRRERKQNQAGRGPALQISRKGSWHSATVCLVALMFTLADALGEGFRNPPPGSFNLGRAGGRIAHIDDASAIHQNPANMLDLSGPEFQITPSAVRIEVDFESPTGQKATTKDPWKALPNLFLAAPLETDKLAVGLGVTTPYGLGNSWDENSSAFNSPSSVLRYNAPYATDLMTVNFNPGLAVKLTESLRIGAGLDVMWSELSMKQFYPWGMTFPGARDGRAIAEGDGVGIGGNVGITWQFTERQRLAFTFRSAMDIDYRGDFSIDNVPPMAGYMGLGSRSDFTSQLQFPNIFAIGYGIELTKNIRVGADLEWLQFSRFESLDLDFGHNNVLIPNRSVRQDWDDTITVGIGGDWRFAPNWVLRAGYQFYESPVPDSTFSPTIPDADQNVITVGLGYRYKRHAFEIAYGADFYDEREITDNQNPALNGDYEMTVHLFSLAYSFRF